MLSHLAWISRIDPHPSSGWSCTVWSVRMRPAMPGDWLIRSEISQYRWWHHLQVTLWWHHQSTFGGESKDSGLLMMSPLGTFQPGQVRPGKQAIMWKINWQYWGIEPQAPWGLTQYRPTKLTCRCKEANRSPAPFLPEWESMWSALVCCSSVCWLVPIFLSMFSCAQGISKLRCTWLLWWWLPWKVLSHPCWIWR